MKTNEQRTVFDNFPLIASDKPLVSDNFYAWLKDTETFKPANCRQSRHNRFFKSLDLYLSGYGYDIKKHTIKSEALKTLEYVHEIYLRMFTPIKDTKLTNLLRPVDSGEFWIQGHKSMDRVKPTALLRSVLNDIGLVYDINPKHYYFEIVNGYLFIKYQSIIGSRRLCKLSS